MSPESDPNPYAPPAAALDAGRPAELPEIVPARRLTRFAGSVLDGLIVGLPGAVLVFAMGGIDEQAPFKLPAATLVAFVALNLGFLGLNIWLWSKRAQSIGKVIVRTRITTPDGRPASLKRILVRQLPLFLLSVAPEFLRAPANLLSLVDALPIFSDERRCLHDHWAGTIVVEAGPGNDPANVERA
jgi:uncharacterized RDD family membrane protein YckC